jgi:hypothetical protein
VVPAPAFRARLGPALPRALPSRCPPEPTSLPLLSLSPGGPLAQAWHGPTLADEALDFGPLALLAPLRRRLDSAATIDRPLPPDPPLAFSHGPVLSLLLAARLGQPTALVNGPAWARRTGAELLGDLPAEVRNDDRLGRALDAFFSQGHAILPAVAAQALPRAERPRDRRHFDPTPRAFSGAYEASAPRPPDTPWPPGAASADVPPAHLTHGYGAAAKLSQVGVTAVGDELGAVPLRAQCLDGPSNGPTAIRPQGDWLWEAGLLRPGTLLLSDRGPGALEPLARLHRHGCPVLC